MEFTYKIEKKFLNTKLSNLKDQKQIQNVVLKVKTEMTTNYDRKIIYNF